MKDGALRLGAFLIGLINFQPGQGGNLATASRKSCFGEGGGGSQRFCGSPRNKVQQERVKKFGQKVLAY